MNLMDDSEVWNMNKINEIVASGKTTRVNLKSPIEILLLYWTAGADKKTNCILTRMFIIGMPVCWKNLINLWRLRK